jgi:hypothetical protein
MFNIVVGIVGMLLGPCDVQKGAMDMFLQGVGVFGCRGLFGYVIMMGMFYH